MSSIAEKIKISRERLGYSQSQLADKANVSLRTIQRLEGEKNIPRGYTLSVLAQALDLDISELASEQNHQTTEAEEAQIQLINIAVLAFIAIPFGNIMLPLFLWNKWGKSAVVDESGRRIINFQIIWTLATSIILLCTPLLHVLLFDTSTPLMIFVLLVLYAINVFVVIKVASTIRQKEFNILESRIRFL